jgi:hypothetical protein
VTLNCAGLKDRLKNGVWAECSRAVTFLLSITALKSRGVCPYQLLFGFKPKLPESLRSFGEVGVVTTKSDIQGKLRNRGTVCMFVGYLFYRAHDVYCTLNLETNHVINSRDIKWLMLYHKNWINKNNQVKRIAYDDDDDNVIEFLMIQKVNNGLSQILIQLNLRSSIQAISRFIVRRSDWRAVSILSLQNINNFEQGRDILIDSVNVALICGNTMKEPQSFDNA